MVNLLKKKGVFFQMDENVTCNYERGIVAFIDVLGFSNYIKHEHNPEMVNDLFIFMKKIIYLYSTSKLSGVKIAFFSDSFILTTTNLSAEGLSAMMAATYMIQTHLYSKLKLCARGAVTVGNFYNNDNVAFGDGIISAYENEKYAKYARIIITQDLVNLIGNELIEKSLIEKDIDGLYYYNFIYFELVDACRENNKNWNKDIVRDNLSRKRIEIDFLIRKHINTLYIDKYIWLVTPFNKVCYEISELLNDKEFENILIDIKVYN